MFDHNFTLIEKEDRIELVYNTLFKLTFFILFSFCLFIMAINNLFSKSIFVLSMIFFLRFAISKKWTFSAKYVIKESKFLFITYKKVSYDFEKISAFKYMFFYRGYQNITEAEGKMFKKPAERLSFYYNDISDILIEISLGKNSNLKQLGQIISSYCGKELSFT